MKEMTRILTLAMAFAPMASFAAEISLGDPYCFVDQVIDLDKMLYYKLDLCNGSSWVACWADGEDWAAVPIDGAGDEDELTPVVVYGSADASMLSNVHIEDEADFKARIESANFMEYNVTPTDRTNPNDIKSFVASRKWLMAKINRSSKKFAPKTFFMGLKGCIEYRRFVIVCESLDDAERARYNEKGEAKVSQLSPIVPGESVDVELVGYTAKGLPTGLKYNAKTGYVTCTAKAGGEYVALFTKDGEPDEIVIFTIRAEEVSVGCEGLSSVTFVAGVAGNADGIPLEVEAETGVKSVTVTKLPTGMKYDAKSGRITGAPTKAGDYSVTLTVTTAGGAKQAVTIPVAVAALPEAVVGTFNGFVKSGYGENVGTFQLTATDAGKLTAKVTTASGTYTFSGTCWDSVEEGVYSATLNTKKGDALTLSLNSFLGWNGTQLTGEFAAAGGAWREVEARKNAFGKTWYFNAEGNVDDGWELSYAENAKTAALTVTLNADGTTKVAGKLGALSASASGYADVTEIAGGVIYADFVSVVSVKDGKTTLKRALSIQANLWFDRSNDHLEGVGTAQIVKE